MRTMLQTIDSLLRGNLTEKTTLDAGQLDVPVRTLAKAAAALGSIYGVCMGLFAVLHPEGPGLRQLASTAVKVPLLFLATLAVTLPSLYVTSALARSSLRPDATTRLLLVAIAVNLALLASLGPITAFFTLSTDSYAFMVLLNVAFFGIAGLVGLGFLKRALTFVFRDPSDEGPTPDGSGGYVPQSARRVLQVWLVLFGVVGAQMGWILRPFIGSPDLPFRLVATRESNVFAGIGRAIAQLFS